MKYMLRLLLSSTEQHKPDSSLKQGPLLQITDTCIYNCIFYELMTKKNTFYSGSLQVSSLCLEVFGLLFK